VSVGAVNRSNQLAPADAQLAWLRDLGFVGVDCFSK
jgi:hypothetical protein